MCLSPFTLYVTLKLSIIHGNKLSPVVFIRKNYFGQLLSAHFLIREIVNLRLTFAVCRSSL